MIRASRSNYRRSGWSLLHVLIAMPLFMAFMLLPGKLFFAHINLSHSAQQQPEDGTLMDRVIYQLRRECWTAQGVTVSDDGTMLLLNGADHGAWHVDARGLLRTGPDNQPEIRHSNPGPIRFSTAPGAVVLWIDQTPISIPTGPAALNPQPRTSP